MTPLQSELLQRLDAVLSEEGGTIRQVKDGRGFFYSFDRRPWAIEQVDMDALIALDYFWVQPQVWCGGRTVTRTNKEP